jgi:hypothetical protein
MKLPDGGDQESAKISRKCKLELKHRGKCKSEKKRQAVVENAVRRILYDII